jgi:hypothetical protein
MSSLNYDEVARLISETGPDDADVRAALLTLVDKVHVQQDGRRETKHQQKLEYTRLTHNNHLQVVGAYGVAAEKVVDKLVSVRSELKDKPAPTRSRSRKSKSNEEMPQA